MRARDSVCQNRCRMQGIWVVGDCSNTGYTGESIPLHSIPLSRWNSTRNEKKTKEVLEVGWFMRSENRGAVEDFFDLGFAATVKTYSFSWSVYSSLSLVESLTFSWYCMRHEFAISWKPSDYSRLPHCQTSTLPHFHTSTLPHFHTSILTHCHTSTLPDFQTSRLPDFHTATLSHFHTSTLPDFHTSTLPHFHTSTLPHCQTAGLQTYKIIQN